MIYDAVIIGAGPAGIVAARELSEYSRVLLIEKGSDVKYSDCRIVDKCFHCNVCGNICGIGGAGGRSDGKLTYGRVGMNKELYGDNYENEMTVILDMIMENSDSLNNASSEEKPYEKESEYFKEAAETYHLGTKAIRQAFQRLYDRLTCDKLRNCLVTGIVRTGGVFHITTSMGRYSAYSVIVATGKGDDSLFRSYDDMGVKRTGVCSSIGVRLELPNSGLQKMKSMSNNMKIKKYYDNAYVKTHCFCYSGDIIPYNALGNTLVGGRADPILPRLTSNVNILNRYNNNDSLEIVLNTIKRFNIATDGNVMYQSVDEFLDTNITKGRHILCREWERRGDVKDCFDSNTYNNIRDFLLSLHNDGIINLDCGLVHGPAAEWIIPQADVNFNFETNVSGLYIVGDGSGMTQGILSAAVSARRASLSLLSGLEAAS